MTYRYITKLEKLCISGKQEADIMYKAMDIAQYVVNYSIEKDNPVSNLKLQKLLYYIQDAFLVEKGEPCFIIVF